VPIPALKFHKTKFPRGGNAMEQELAVVEQVAEIEVIELSLEELAQVGGGMGGLGVLQ
jgi:hypothetical protein